MKLPKQISIGNFTFDNVNDEYYECRGDQYFDEEHDQVPEPALQEAATKLEVKLKEQGYSTDVQHGEKGWIEVNFTK